MTDTRSLGETAALVTGGSSGIGFGLARMLIEEGAAVTIVARRPDNLKRAAGELRSLGGDVLDVAADVGASAEMRRAVDAHAERFGRLDVLVNSAGLAVPGKPGRQNPATVASMLSVDLGSVVLSYWAALDLLTSAAEHRGVARVINIASITGFTAQPWLAVYSATKAAVINYTSSMNQAFAAAGVLSTAVCPGFVDTPMSEGARGQDPDKMISVDDIIELVRPLFRLSNRSYVPEIVIARTASQDPSGL